MATLIGDVFTDSSRFHGMIGGPGVQHQHDGHTHYRNRSVSRSRDRETPSHQRRSSVSPRRQASATSATSQYPAPNGRDWDDTKLVQADKGQQAQQTSSSGGASRFPSPPSSSSPSETSSAASRPQHGTPAYMASSTRESGPAAVSSSAAGSAVSSASTATTAIPPSRLMPSPDSDGGPRLVYSGPTNSSQDASMNIDGADSPIQTQTTIRVRDLAHIQSLARADLLTGNGQGSLNDPPLQQMKYEISSMPIGDIIEMVAALLTKITTTNDLQHDALNRNAAHIKQAQAQAKAEEGSGEGNMSPMSSSVLAFHGKNVPAITILSYLSRIHKYCPTTYEVFLSLLVYFDRMTERVNDLVMKSEETRRAQVAAAARTDQPRSAEVKPATGNADPDTVMHDEDSEESDETDSDLADDDDDEDDAQRPSRDSAGGAPIVVPPPDNSATAASSATYFVVDSFNIHRLIIAGVTCASKFFSDVFYTNSRYAKVGGLPLAELNHLELQFLLLNDFRLAVPVEDLEAYATMLVEFYSREVVAQRSRPTVGTD